MIAKLEAKYSRFYYITGAVCVLSVPLGLMCVSSMVWALNQESSLLHLIAFAVNAFGAHTGYKTFSETLDTVRKIRINKLVVSAHLLRQRIEFMQKLEDDLATPSDMLEVSRTHTEETIELSMNHSLGVQLKIITND